MIEMYSNLGILAGGPLYTQIDDRLESFLMVFSSLKQFSLKLNIVLQNFVVSRVGLFFQYLKLISYCVVRFPKLEWRP